MIKKFLITMTIVSFLLVACGKTEIDYNIEDETAVIKENNRKIVVWTTYWDTENLEKEIKKLSNNIEAISYFAAYFDENKQIFVPEEIDVTYNMIKEKYSEEDYGSYLSIVNDLIKEDGSSSLKDIELLYELLSTKNSMEKHIEEIINLVLNKGFQGVEIDYEGMKDNIELWNLFIEFIEKLQLETNKEGLKLRVLLEPSFPIDTIELPEGPEYTIMCYNLHGKGTKPGPKADKSFILNMIEKAEKIPGKKNFAMATGGFKFYEDKVEQLSERQAVELLNIFSSTVTRDKESKALYFSYVESDIEYEIWYADNETIDYWMNIVEKRVDDDYGLSLWKLGGNISLGF